jgi:hypothetical protein
VVDMLCNRNEMIDIFFLENSELHGVP